MTFYEIIKIGNEKIAFSSCNVIYKKEQFVKREFTSIIGKNFLTTVAGRKDAALSPVR